MSGNVSFPPASDATALLQDSNTLGTKRTRDEVDETALDTRPFVIRDQADPFSRPKSFTPLCLLSRAQLPLAYLDTTHSGGRLFFASIPTLEACHRHGEETNVLVAHEEKERRLYAVERVTTGRYALCRLHKFVRETAILENLKLFSQTDERQIKRRALSTTENGEPWWMKAAVEVPENKDRDVATVPLPSLMMRRAMQAPQKISESHAEVQAQPVELPALEAPTLGADPTSGMASTEDKIQDLATNYLETLYIERTSLAYFSKGPLPRARAALCVGSPDAMPMDLIGFLRQSILTSATMDQKYRTGIIELVKELPVASSQSPENTAKRKTKRKKKWKPKRSKAGFFVYEDEYVERWWRNEDAQSSTETTNDGLRRRVPKLRMRETFLQLMLILEVLALEEAHPPKEPAVSAALTPVDSQIKETQATESQVTDTKPRPKKKQDLPATLDTILDKLCIWHSLESHSPTKLRAGENGQDETEPDGALTSFCVEVIIPFYSSRIPQYANLVNKKLGGPSASTPNKRKSTTTRRPGEPATRPVPEKKPRQPLARVSTDTLNRPHKVPPTLQRSATDSGAQPQIKREGTDTLPLLNSIPTSAKAPQSRRPRVDPLQRLASSTSRRVMDVSAMSQASEAKLRKKAERAEMIKEAVEGIKKPKRALAAEQEKVDESFAKAVAKGARPQQRAKKAVAEHGTAKVAATPSRYGVRKVGVTPHRGVTTTSGYTEDTIPSSASIVPSSSTYLRAHAPTVTFASPSRPRAMEPMDSTDGHVPVFTVPQTGHRARHFSALLGQAKTSSTLAVEDTPSRGFARFMPRGLATDPGTGTLESPIARRKNAAVVESTPIKTPVMFSQREVDATPVRPAIGTVAEATPFPASKTLDSSMMNGDTHGGVGASDSLYAALGWDMDNGYEELA